MKTIATLGLVVSLMTFSCKKSIEQPTVAVHEKSPYRVLVIGQGDTTTSSVMFARTETVGLALAEDDKLRAELIAYDGHGSYTVKVTNKQPCQVIIRWGWEELRIDNISPSSDVITANQSQIFTLTGDAKVGKIKLQAQGVDCGNSSTLIINITQTILPIKLVENVATYDKETDKVTVSFSIDDPASSDWILIQKQNKDLVWVQAALVACDHSTKKYSIKL